MAPAKSEVMVTLPKLPLSGRSFQGRHAVRTVVTLGLGPKDISDAEPAPTVHQLAHQLKMCPFRGWCPIMNPARH